MRKSIFLLSLPLFLFTACIKDVKPWEKETLGKETMKESGPTPLIKKFEEHIYYSKEASKGGGGMSGGGCGCN
ncbi:MAG TPA: DUF4266 domain-containing protein [Sulfurimonas sp.]|nr:DUF4266 domain-containing protein [Sulfurimonas sp.]